MSNTPVYWYMVTREDLLDVLLGEQSPEALTYSRFSPHDIPEGHVVLGYSTTPQVDSYSPPALVLLDDKSVTETISWLRTFASEASPISQYCRVALLSDWNLFSQNENRGSALNGRPDRWACVVVGEALVHMEGDAELEHMPLSRLSSCLGLAMGRTALLFQKGEPFTACERRLRVIASDGRFSRRTISIDDMYPAWSIASSKLPPAESAGDAVMHVLSLASQFLKNQANLDSERAIVNLVQNQSNLFSDSVEERLLAFNYFAGEISANSKRLSELSLGLLLASAAFLVGRSTSHAFLLRRYGPISSHAFVWFGAIAAVAGPRAWDASWLRAVKGAERLLKADFNWLSTPIADIAWTEFAWLAGTFDDVEQISLVPKMLPRTLGLEIVPGVALQIRLGNGPTEIEGKVGNGTPTHEKSLTEALGQFISLAQRVKSLVEPATAVSPQQSLGFEAETNPIGKNSRTKRKRSSGNT